MLATLVYFISSYFYGNVKDNTIIKYDANDKSLQNIILKQRKQIPS